MQKIISALALLLTTIITTAQDSASTHTIKIAGTRFTYPIVQKWIDEYTKINPLAKIRIETKVPADSLDILIVSHILRPGDVKENHVSVTLNRYILLPVVNSERSDLKQLQQKGISGDTWKHIFFTNEQGNNDTTSGNEWIVYKREKPSCSSIAFANHFGNEQKDINGIPVPGDDRDLLAVVKKDKNAISYSSPCITYNIKNRKVVDSVAIVPIDLNNNGVIDEGEGIYATLDDLLSYSEKTNDPSIPVDRVHAIYRSKADKEVTEFLKWILIKGQQYNHEYGFLNLDGDTIQSEKDQLVTSVLKSCSPSGRRLVKYSASH